MTLVKNIILYSNISFQLSLIFLLLVDKIGNLAARNYGCICKGDYNFFKVFFI